MAAAIFRVNVYLLKVFRRHTEQEVSVQYDVKALTAGN
jgi:hypothetical protein